ncbi:hypothetical protein ACIXMO_02825 [Bacteroides fragilis]
MKVRKNILFTGLILLQLLALPGEVYGMDHAVMAVMKKKHDVHTNTHFQTKAGEIFCLLFAVILKRINYS